MFALSEAFPALLNYFPLVLLLSHTYISHHIYNLYHITVSLLPPNTKFLSLEIIYLKELYFSLNRPSFIQSVTKGNCSNKFE